MTLALAQKGAKGKGVQIANKIIKEWSDLAVSGRGGGVASVPEGRGGSGRGGQHGDGLGPLLAEALALTGRPLRSPTPAMSHRRRRRRRRRRTRKLGLRGQ